MHMNDNARQMHTPKAASDFHVLIIYFFLALYKFILINISGV